MSDREELITNLRQLARFLHDDFTIGEEAADVIEELQAKLDALEAENARMKASLSKFQHSEFHPDWSLLDASQESLREYMALLKDVYATNARLRASIADAIDYLDTAEGGNADEVLRNALKEE